MSVFEELKEEISKCERCPELVKSRTQTVFGEGTPEAEVMFIGEAPGADEDRVGMPFVGRSGQLMNKAMEDAGIPRSKVFIGNTLKCRPPDNRNPLPEEMENCATFLAAQIAIIKPKIIVPLGNFGLKRMLGNDMTIGKVHGQQIKKDGIYYFPMYHPASALHNPANREHIFKDFRKLAKLLKREGLF